MGQRSQIYVRYNNKIIIANYYQWNYGERMISRARYGIEYIKHYIDNEFDFVFSDKQYIKKISRIFDANFDMKDVALSSNIFDEFKEEKNYYKENNIEVSFNDFIFKHQDNNDGKLFVDIQDNKIKYAFTDYDCEKVMNAEQYMIWDMEDWIEKLKEYESEDTIKTCQENMEEISKMAILMTKEELEEFINYNYEIDVE